MDLSFNPADLVTPAGIVVAGAIVRMVVELLKNLIAWIDNGRERAFTALVALLLYGYWYWSFASGVPNGAWLAFTAFLAVTATAFGVNEAIDAGQGQLAKVVVKAAPVDEGQLVDVEEPPDAPDEPDVAPGP